jgi:hypothetical protein
MRGGDEGGGLAFRRLDAPGGAAGAGGLGGARAAGRGVQDDAARIGLRERGCRTPRERELPRGEQDGFLPVRDEGGA